MPLWSILYAGMIFASASGTIMMSGRRDILYITAEFLSAALSIMFFAIYYGVVAYPSTIMIPLGMIAFVLFQELWINRQLYHFLTDEELDAAEKKFLLWFVGFFLFLFLSPFLWVIVEVFKHYL
jgi:hypothetical protein